MLHLHHQGFTHSTKRFTNTTKGLLIQQKVNLHNNRFTYTTKGVLTQQQVYQQKVYLHNRRFTYICIKGVEVRPGGLVLELVVKFLLKDQTSLKSV